MTKMPDPLIPRRDIDFLLYEWLEAETLPVAPGAEAHSRDTWDAVLDLSEQLAAEVFLPIYKATDQHEPQLTAHGVQVLPAVAAALQQYAEAGLFGASFDPNLGGSGLPYLICTASFAQFAAASIATAAYAMLTSANARLIVEFGTPEQIEQFARPQIEGAWFGTMCLSEPEAGSSLGDISTRATPDGADRLGARYALVGNKMWISGGDHQIAGNIVHLVLAKIPDTDGELPAGTKSLALFVVPKRLPDGTLNDVVVAGINHKMGYRGTSNCLLNFGEKGGAVGWLVGEPGAGIRQMFQMMNEARIGVSVGAAALGYRGYRHALQYARDRRQGRVSGIREGAPVAIIEHADVKHMLLTQKAYVEGAMALCLYCAKLVDESADAAAADLLELLTPIAKTWSSEFGLAANDIAIQVHGGFGYTRDFDVEQLYRDNRLNPIHEGTTGIQGLDLLGRKILRPGAGGLAALRARLLNTQLAAGGGPLAAQAEALEDAWGEIVAAIDLLRTAPQGRVLDNSTAFLRAFGQVVMAWIWLDQALIAQQGIDEERGDYDFYSGKVRACAYFFEWEFPKYRVLLAPVATSELAATMPVDQF
jgi:alkylation response protein AidB-like acyl-CoA dehydrogenase